MLKGRKITLEIVYDDEQSSDPLDWNWNALLDLYWNEQVTISSPSEFQISDELRAELEDKSLDSPA